MCEYDMTEEEWEQHLQDYAEWFDSQEELYELEEEK